MRTRPSSGALLWDWDPQKGPQGANKFAILTFSKTVKLLWAYSQFGLVAIYSALKKSSTKTLIYRVNPEIPENTRHTQKYPKCPEIPESKKDTCHQDFLSIELNDL